MGEESRVSFSHEPVLLDEVIESLAGYTLTARRAAAGIHRR